MKPARFVCALFGVALLLVAACGSSDSKTLDVFAAASLTSAFTELAETYEASTPAVEVRFNFAGSSALREQLNDGAEADVFASANASIMESLVEAGEIDGQPQVFAQNRLVLAVPSGNPGRLVGMADLSRTELLIGVCAPGVPCGDLAAMIIDDAGVDASVDTFESNVKSLVNRLIDGELDAGLVYVTDVLAADGSLEVLSTAASDRLVSYPIVSISADAEAQGFVDFVTSDQGRAVLSEWGFEAP